MRWSWVMIWWGGYLPTVSDLAGWTNPSCKLVQMGFKGMYIIIIIIIIIIMIILISGWADGFTVPQSLGWIQTDHQTEG